MAAHTPIDLVFPMMFAPCPYSSSGKSHLDFSSSTVTSSDPDPKCLTTISMSVFHSSYCVTWLAYKLLPLGSKR